MRGKYGNETRQPFTFADGYDPMGVAPDGLDIYILNSGETFGAIIIIIIIISESFLRENRRPHPLIISGWLSTKINFSAFPATVYVYFGEATGHIYVSLRKSLTATMRMPKPTFDHDTPANHRLAQVVSKCPKILSFKFQ